VHPKSITSFIVFAIFGSSEHNEEYMKAMSGGYILGMSPYTPMICFFNHSLALEHISTSTTPCPEKEKRGLEVEG
jgi:hypothetical protein